VVICSLVMQLLHMVLIKSLSKTQIVILNLPITLRLWQEVVPQLEEKLLFLLHQRACSLLKHFINHLILQNSMKTASLPKLLKNGGLIHFLEEDHC
jgi:hypothetical protein